MNQQKCSNSMKAQDRVRASSCPVRHVKHQQHLVSKGAGIQVQAKWAQVFQGAVMRKDQVECPAFQLQSPKMQAR